MSLKDKLRSLIEATFTSKKAFIAQQSTVNYNEQSTSSVTSGQTFVSTINGYARLHAVTNGANGELSVDFGVSDRLVTVQARQSGNWVDFLFPVAKGNTYRIQGSDLESATVTLFSLIGGGYLSSFVKSLCGGGLCLLSHLSKRFLNLSLIGQAQRNKLAIKCLRQQDLIGTRRLFLRLTDLRQCISLAWFNPFTSQTSKLPEAFLRSLGIHSLAQFIRNTLLLLEKAKYFVSAFMRTKAGLQLSILPHGSARLDFCKGGAL